jgi:hypothetical protein
VTAVTLGAWRLGAYQTGLEHREAFGPPPLLCSYGETDFADVTGLACLDEARPKGERSLAGSTGLEPAASGVTGRRSNQLNYDPDWN